MSKERRLGNQEEKAKEGDGVKRGKRSSREEERRGILDGRKR